MSTNGAVNQRILVMTSNVFFARRLTEALKAHGFDVTQQHAAGLRAHYAGVERAHGDPLRDQSARDERLRSSKNSA